ncbi:MAG: hypothetical protein U0872_07070 [Planctomycetaceae bacterium]
MGKRPDDRYHEIGCRTIRCQRQCAKALKSQFAGQRVRQEPHQPYIEPAMHLFRQGLLIQEIAATVPTAGSQFAQPSKAWHEDRGLQYPMVEHAAKPWN